MDDMNLTTVPGMISAEPDQGLVWFGVLHVGGGLTVKRYHSWEDHKEAGDSDLTRHVTRLFEAPDRSHALIEAIRLTKAHCG